jgi:integrase
VPKNRRVPSYRYHKASDQAVVVLDGRSHYLGAWNSPESRADYDRLIAEWLASGRRASSPEPVSAVAAPTVAEVILAFWRHAEDHYRAPDGTPSGELINLKVALKPLRKLHGETLAREFGPLALRAVRDEMVRSGLARSSVNARVDRIRRAFRWAASVELVPSPVVQALATVAGLQKGRTTARETDPVGPVGVDHVEKTLPYLSRPVAALVRIQLLTGMRPGEACSMRGRDLTPGELAWTYRPGSHKTAWRGKAREIAIGPKALEILREFRKPDPDAYLFDPREAVSEHHAAREAARKSRPTPSENAKRVGQAGEKHGRRYGRASYRNAILRACQKAGVPGWSPNQLRHSAATTIRARFGLEAAQAVLGHARADVTQVYAARDLSRAVEVVREIG